MISFMKAVKAVFSNIRKQLERHRTASEAKRVHRENVRSTTTVTQGEDPVTVEGTTVYTRDGRAVTFPGIDSDVVVARYIGGDPDVLRQLMEDT